MIDMKQILVKDMNNTHRIIGLPINNDYGPVSSVILSSRGIVAYICRQHIILLHTRSVLQFTIEVLVLT